MIIRKFKIAEGIRVDLDINEQYQHALAKCHDIGQLIELQNRASHESDPVAGDQK